MLGRGFGAAALGAVAGRVLWGGRDDEEYIQPPHRYGWQINPDKCTYCGLCATACVRAPSAVKAVNDQKKCSNCVVCYGHIHDRDLPSDRIDRDGRRVCPRDAVCRAALAGGLDGAYLYTVKCEQCDGCGKCALECNLHGSRSMFLIIRPDLCLGCNDCSIARVCEAGAVERVQSSRISDFRGVPPPPYTSA